MTRWVRALATTGLNPGACCVVRVEGREIALARLGESAFYALDNACPHSGGSLGDGYVVRDKILLRRPSGRRSAMVAPKPEEPSDDCFTGFGEIPSSPLSVRRRWISCPWHGWPFELATGMGPEGECVPTYPVRIADGWVEIGL
jgi:nitrite reductase/ring-hydroxylating ferredoxin subunit